MSLWQAFAWGAGLAYGFAIAAVLYLLKQAFLEPLYEALLEWWEKRLKPAPVEAATSQPQRLLQSETFVISDLHIDTWHKVPLIEGKTRQQHFEKFLDAIKRTALELYVNGDLVDMPPHPAEVWTDPDGRVTLRQTLIPKYAPILRKLAQFNAGDERTRTMTMYMAGNHDMAGSGIRYLLHHLWDLVPDARLPFQNVWYGHYIIHAPYGATEGSAQYRFLMEHGHYHDPVLVLYLLQFVVGVMASNLEAAMDSLTVAGQRRLSPKAAPPTPGVAAARPAAARETFGHRIVKWRWRWKARRQLGRMNRRAKEAKERPLDGILMGHTHIPDYYVFRLGGVHGKVYVNTGDWSGDTGHASYAVITQEGIVHLYDWHANRPAHHRPSVA